MQHRQHQVMIIETRHSASLLLITLHPLEMEPAYLNIMCAFRNIFVVIVVVDGIDVNSFLRAQSQMVPHTRKPPSPRACMEPSYCIVRTSVQMARRYRLLIVAALQS